MLVTGRAAGGERGGSGNNSGRIRRRGRSGRSRGRGGGDIAVVALFGEATTAAVITAASFRGTDVEVERRIIGGGRRDVGLVLTVHRRI